MKITRHTAPDMRQALRLVRERLGNDAVIMSSRHTSRGVEITAAIDFDAGEIDTPAAHAAPARRAAPAVPAMPAAPAARSVPAASRISFPADMELPPEDLLADLDEDKVSIGSQSGAASDGILGQELKTLRRILETQMAQLAWNDLTRRAPIHSEILRELTEVGLAHDFAAQIVAQLPAGMDLAQARRLAIALVSQRLPVTGDRWLDNGGRVALVGPTGVGKTTTLTKLAVRWVLRHGPRDLAIISADPFRLGAHDHLQALGRMVGAPVYTVESLAEIATLAPHIGARRFVLIDTPGSSQRDAQLPARLNELAHNEAGFETALVLSASTQAGAIQECVARFAPARPACCLLTKVDEAASLGGVLSVLTSVHLPISYVSEGQRIPEDLRPARALELVSSAVRLARSSGAAADEDLLTRRYGDIAHGLA